MLILQYISYSALRLFIASLNRTTNEQESEDTFEWWSYKYMVQELGQELADDLVSRHQQQDPLITGKFIRKPIGSNNVYSFEPST